MKPYIENSSSTPEQHTFNYRQSRARMVVEKLSREMAVPTEKNGL